MSLAPVENKAFPRRAISLLTGYCGKVEPCDLLLSLEGARRFAEVNAHTLMKSASTLMEATKLASPPFQRASWRSSFGRQPITICLLVFVGYYLGARIGFSLTFQPHPVSVLWPPNSILLAALLLTPPRIWWLVLIAAFPAHCAAQWQSNVPTSMILCWFISNCFEALIGASLTRYFLRGPLRFVSLRKSAFFASAPRSAVPFSLPSWTRHSCAGINGGATAIGSSGKFGSVQMFWPFSSSRLSS